MIIRAVSANEENRDGGWLTLTQSRTGGKSNRWLLPFLYVAATLLAAGTLLLVDPRKTLLLPCLFRTFTGLDCPGCGMTRAFYCLLHFNFAGAFRYNPFSFLLAPLLALFWTNGLIYFLRGRGFLHLKKVPVTAIIVCVALLILFALGRNIPGSPLFFFRV